MDEKDLILRQLAIYDQLMLNYAAERDAYEGVEEFNTLSDHLDVLVMDYPMMRQWFVRKIMLLDERKRLANIK